MDRLLDSQTANEKALSYRPDDEKFKQRREALRNMLHPGRNDPRPTRLSLGSGGKPTLSYRCTDMYPGPGIEELIDQAKVPYNDATVQAIYSEHALEHSASHYVAADTIKEWSRVLRHGGHLVIKMPDLDSCCAHFLQSPERPRQPHERWTEKEWYKYTIYGIQTSLNAEPPEGQYHRTGFTKEGIKRELEKNGFEIRKLENYDGYGTPSMLVEAVQVQQPMRIAWMIPGPIDENHGSLRIRRLNVHRWLQTHGVDSRIIDYYGRDVYEDAKHADVCIFISFGPEEKKLIERLKRRGVKIIFDHCEALFDLPHQRECYEMADIITCCSTVLSEMSRHFGRTVCLHDAYEPEN
jgi:predicted SAM-dependent methyltransferase